MALLPHHIVEQYLQDNTDGQFKAFVLFVDLTGFTKLTNNIMTQKGEEGAEILSAILNDVFAPLVKNVYALEGFIPYFAGDAFIGIFEVAEDLERRLLDCLRSASHVQQFFLDKNTWSTQYGDFNIQAKIGVALGDIEWGIVGEKHKGFYYHGEGIKKAVEQQSFAEPNQVILDKEVVTLLPAFIDYGIVSDNQHYFLAHRFADFIPLPTQRAKITEKILQFFYTKPIYRSNQQGEFREVVSIFLSFRAALSYDNIQAISTICIEEYFNFGGYFKEIDITDKGAILLGFFGAPLTYGDNVQRALAYINAIVERLEALAFPFDYKVGMTSGQCFVGNIGGAERYQYAIVGNKVNLAARLLAQANWGEILFDESITKVQGHKFESKGSIHYKGIKGDIPTFAYQGMTGYFKNFFDGEMIGRQEELQAMYQLGKAAFLEKKIKIGVLYGEAGIGKSRLAFEIKNKLQNEFSIKTYLCQADQILQKPFNPFIYFLKTYFNQSSEQSQEENHKAFQEKFDELLAFTSESESYPKIRQELIRTKSILAARVGLTLANSLWTQLDGKGRLQNTIDAFINLLKVEVQAEPFVLEIEDAHWLDDSSKQLLQKIVVELKDEPIFCLVTSRYTDDSSKPQIFDKKVPILEIDLNILTEKALRTFAETKINGKISKELFQALLKSSNGNPFYAEQILEYFHESDLLVKKGDVWHKKDKNIKLSNSMKSILMARIDRLSDLVKETVKAAAVIGREFEIRVLSEVMKSNKSFRKKNGDAELLLKDQIGVAERGQIWKAVNEIRYIFKHSLLREAVYDMQLKARVRKLHRLIAEAIEKLYHDRLEERYADLAFHYEQAGLEKKHLHFLEKAADNYKSNFQNNIAIEQYNKLIKGIDLINDKEKYIKTLLKRASVLTLIGDWTKGEKDLRLALATAQQLNKPDLLGRANNKLGKLLLLVGEYNQAKDILNTALHYFDAVKDDIGTYKALGNLGDLHFRQGEYDTAREYYKKSLLISDALNQALQNTSVVSNLGLTYMNQGDFENAIFFMEPQLALCQAASNKLGVANLSIFLGIVCFEKGDYEKAMNYYQMGLKESEALGDQHLISIAIGCIGNIYERRGDFKKAMQLFEDDLAICKRIGDKQGISIAFGLIGDLLTIQGKPDEAIPNLEQQLLLCENLQYKKGEAKAHSTLGDAYFYKKEYQKAVQHYDIAIVLSKEIKNKRNLAYTLFQKAKLLLEDNAALSVIEKNAAEFLEAATAMTNQELLYFAKILMQKIEILKGNKSQGEAKLLQLSQIALNDEQKAAVHYALATSGLERTKDYATISLMTYKALYKENAKYLYKKRINILSSIAPSIA